MIKLSILITFAFTTFAADPAEVLKRIRENDLTWLKSQAADPTFVKSADARKNTPLLWAATLGSAEAVDILLAAGANPNEANALGLTPLIVGATEPAKVKSLLAKGADPKAKSQIGQHALAVAAGSPRATASVKMLLAAGANPNERGARGTTPLLSAAGVTCAEANANALLAAGADAKTADGAGFNILHAAPGCSLPFVKTMVAAGANPNQQNTMAGTSKRGPVQLIGLTPLMLVAAHGTPAMLQVLIDAGADINIKDVRGMTALHFAVSSEDQSAANVKLLLAKGADPKLKDKAGEDVLTWAAKFNNPEVLAVLGAKPQPITPMKLLAAKGPGPQAALTLLEKTNETFFQESGCGSCHHATALALAASHAKAAGLQVNPGLEQARGMRLKGMLGAFSTTLQQMIGPPGDIDSTLYALLEAKSLNLPSTPDFEIASRYLWARQLPDGHWSMRGVSRSPMEESDIHRTALAILLLPHYSDAASKADSVERVKRAVQWIEAQPARNSDELGMKLLGLKWGGASLTSIAKASKALTVTQLADGSFSGNPHLPGDPYSTGFAIYALRTGAGLQASNPTIAKAANFLRATQREDATWFQKSRAPKFQPYFESGFPYGNDQWISSAATAWAIIGLTESEKQLQAMTNRP